MHDREFYTPNLCKLGGNSVVEVFQQSLVTEIEDFPNNLLTQLVMERARSMWPWLLKPLLPTLLWGMTRAAQCVLLSLNSRPYSPLSHTHTLPCIPQGALV